MREENIRYLDPTLFVTKIPDYFAELSEEEKLENFKSLASHYRKEYTVALHKITNELIPSLNPLHILAHFAFYDNLVIPACDRKTPSENSDYRPLHQGHIEFLQALILKMPLEKLTNKLDAGYESIILQLHKQLGTIHESWSLSRFDQDRDEENVSLIEYLRSRTAMIRNWGDTEQVFEWLELMYSSDDSWLVKRRGISFSKLIHTVRKLMYVLEERINDRKQLLKSFALANSKEEMIKSYFKVDGVSGDRVQEDLKRMMKLPYDLKGLKNILLLHFDRNLTDLFLFTRDDFSSFLDESEVLSVWAIFDEWSLFTHSLEDYEIDHIFMNNPVWNKPLIKLSDEAYFWPLVHVFQSFGLEMLSDLYSPKELENFEMKVKPQFCENKVVELFKKYFPCAEVISNNYYIEEGKHYENDCCVIVDKFCFVVEVKSGRLRGSAKRGSSVSLAKGVNNIIGEGANQAFRFIQHLKRLDDIYDGAGNEREIDVSEVSNFLPVVVTFEHFGEIATNKNILFEAGYLDRGIADAYCVCLPDLERIFQILPSVSQRLHYMVRRPEIEKNFLFKGDELDLLVFYLKTGFAIGDAEYDKEQTFVLSHLSPAELDPYILDTTGEEPRPARFLTERWKRVLQGIEYRKWHGWTKAVIMLLGIDKESMEGLEKKLMEIFARILQGEQKKGDDDIVVSIGGPKGNKFGIVCTVGRRQTNTECRQHSQSGLAMIEKEVGKINALVVAFDVDQLSDPYRALYFVEADKWYG